MENRKNSEPINGFLVDVNYDEDSASYLLQSYLHKLILQFNNFTCSECIRTNMENLFLALLRAAFRLAISLKSDRWSKENEWRMVIFGDYTKSPNSSHSNILLRTRNGTLIDYLSVDLSQSSLEVIGIELGPDFPDEARNSVSILASKSSRIIVK